MANYTIIRDEALFKQFIEWLPILKKNECFYLTLMARKKYCKDLPEGVPGVSRDKAQLRRFTVCDISLMYSKVKQLECELGAYTSERVAIPNEALALYITPNPRDLERVTKLSLIRFANLITEPYSGYNPHQEVLSLMQKTPSKKYYIDFDFDNIEFNDDFLNKIKDAMNIDCVSVVKTRGGFHLLVDTEKVNSKEYRHWYRNLAALGSDVQGDSMLPVVGCCQGGFTPHFLLRS